MIATQEALFDPADELPSLIAAAEAHGWRWVRSWRTDCAPRGLMHPAHPQWARTAQHEFQAPEALAQGWYPHVYERLRCDTLAAWVARGCPVTTKSGI